MQHGVQLAVPDSQESAQQAVRHEKLAFISKLAEFAKATRLSLLCLLQESSRIICTTGIILRSSISPTHRSFMWLAIVNYARVAKSTSSPTSSRAVYRPSRCNLCGSPVALDVRCITGSRDDKILFFYSSFCSFLSSKSHTSIYTPNYYRTVGLMVPEAEKDTGQKN